MHAHALRQSGVSAVSALIVDECARDAARVAIPRAEVHVVARFGSSARDGLDVHAFGARQRVHRKLIRGGQRAVMARLQLGTTALGAPASAIAGRVVALEDLWGHVATRRLTDRLAEARDSAEASAILERAIDERAAIAGPPHAQLRLVLDAAKRLSNTHVNAVADELGVSERHLRRIFRETTGISPKAFAKITRFRRAVSAARATARTSWASIAAASGYYDQAHLISEFRAIAGVTPRELLSELLAREGDASGVQRIDAAVAR